MSHHFDTPTAKEDPRINVCDFYLFRGRPGVGRADAGVRIHGQSTHPPTLRNSSRASAHRSFRMNWTRPPHSALPPSTAAASATT